MYWLIMKSCIITVLVMELLELQQEVQKELIVLHSSGDEIYPYEFNGVSLTQINRVHDIPVAVVFQANKTIDTYYVEIDRGNRRDGPNMLNFDSEFIAGGDDVFASGNVQYDRLNCRLDIVTPKKTKN